MCIARQISAFTRRLVKPVPDGLFGEARCRVVFIEYPTSGKTDGSLRCAAEMPRSRFDQVRGRKDSCSSRAAATCSTCFDFHS